MNQSAQTSIYWLHLPNHTDILSEGYIGVSYRNKRRLWEHKKRTENPHLQNAFKKYKDIVHTILLIGPNDYCYEIEEKLRSTQNIGWNIDKGGILPPSHKGRKHPWAVGKNSPAHLIHVKEKLHQRMIENNPMKNLAVRKKSANSRAKDYIIINLQTRKIYDVHNVAEFCRKHNLTVSNFRQNRSKGWLCRKK